MLSTGPDIDSIQASLLRALASAHRLRIIHRLGIAPCEVKELARELGLGQAAASQHLAAMRAVGLVEAVRDGRSVRYQLTDEEILAACSLMRGCSSAASPSSATLPRRRASPPIWSSLPAR